MFLDEATIKIISGKGGDGCVSFRHEKYVPKGGPDGGDGGNGGNVYIQVNNSIHGLELFRHKKVFQAEHGESGKPRNKHGKNGQDIILGVPPGTVVKDNDEIIIDLKETQDKFLLAKGGNGGWGNTHFASSTNQIPNRFNPGQAGVERELKLEIRYIADCGIVGLPNAGKSTLIKTLTNAKPPIANYPFSSTDVVLGKIVIHNKAIILADIPGLIKDSSQGKGLGIKFLKHILRTNIILHLISIENDDLRQAYQIIRNELKQFSPELLSKNEIIIVTKIDLNSQDTDNNIAKFEKQIKKKVVKISCATGRGDDQLPEIIYQHLTK